MYRGFRQLWWFPGFCPTTVCQRTSGFLLYDQMSKGAAYNNFDDEHSLLCHGSCHLLCLPKNWLPFTTDSDSEQTLRQKGRKTYQTIRVIQSDPLIPSSFQVTYVPVNFWKGPRNHPPKNTQQNDKQIISKTNTLFIPFLKEKQLFGNKKQELILDVYIDFYTYNYISYKYMHMSHKKNLLHSIVLLRKEGTLSRLINKHYNHYIYIYCMGTKIFIKPTSTTKVFLCRFLLS